MRQSHPISPIYDSHSKILILGSFPSVKSRAAGFFYGHPQNRFWKVTSAVFGAAEPETIPEKRKFLLSNGIALWDVIAPARFRVLPTAASATWFRMIWERFSLRRRFPVFLQTEQRPNGCMTGIFSPKPAVRRFFCRRQARPMHRGAWTV